MSIEKGFIWVNDVEATAVVPPEGHIVAARDTGAFLGSDGTVLTALGGGGAFNTEDAQDAVGTILVDSSTIDFTYTDATPEITAIVIDNSITDAKLRNSAALSVIGRSANSAGDPADIAGSTVGHVLQVLAGPTVGFGVANPTYITTSLPSWDNPPPSPSAMDDEFNTGTLDGKWTIASSGTTAAAVAGTIDYTASLTTPIVDAATVKSWLTFQSDNSSLGLVSVYQSYSPATDETFFVRFGWNNRTISTNGEGNISVMLSNTGDSNETIEFGISNGGTSSVPFLQVQNNGAFTTILGTTTAENIMVPSVYLAVWKVSNTYYLGQATDSKGVFSMIGSATKTGVTTMDRASILFKTANETPSIIDGVDFFRYYDSLNYSLVNEDSGSGGLYTDEMAQDAIGAMVDTTIVYTDGTPLLSRAALTGDVTAPAGSNATTIANDAVTYAKIQNVTDARLIGRSAGSAGDAQEITIGDGLSLALGVLENTRVQVRVVGVTFDGNGAPPTAGSIGYVVCTFNGTITGWHIVGDVSGSSVVDVWKASSAIPTDSDRIAGTEKPTLSASQLSSDLGLSTWTSTTASNGDVFGFELESASTLNRVTVELLIQEP